MKTKTSILPAFGTLTWLKPQRLGRTELTVAAALLFAQAALSADFTVTSPGYYYMINGQGPNPTITLERGKTYTFAVSTSSIHPFYINSTGVQNNNISQGTITYTVPTSAGNYSYYCSVHYFGAPFATVAPPPPPPEIRLLSLSISSNLVLRSTGTNTWAVNPQYSTNLAGTNWFAVKVLTNSFLNGVNETICGQPPGEKVFFRINSQPR
jgi:plastocyanin